MFGHVTDERLYMRTLITLLLLLAAPSAFASGFYLPWYAEAFFWLMANPAVPVAILFLVIAAIALYIKRSKK